MYQSISFPLPGAGFGPSQDRVRAQLEQDTRTWGADHPNTQTSRYIYAEALSDSDPQEAERLHREVLAFKQATHGAESVCAGTSYASLGRLLRKRGAYQEAEEMLRRALAIREAHPREWFDAAVTRDELGCVLQATGRTAEARTTRMLGGAAHLICAWAPCSKTTAQGGAPLKTCTRCKAIFYCGPEHQRADWPSHKLVCRRPEGEQ